MRGWQFTAVDQPLRLNNDIPDPVPGRGELIIDTVAEFAGIVSDIGEGVEGVEIGDRVAINTDVDGPGTGDLVISLLTHATQAGKAEP